MTKPNTIEIVEIIKANGFETEIREVHPSKNDPAKPSQFVAVKRLNKGTEFAQLISKQLRAASRTKRAAMIQQLTAAGVTEVHGWTLNELVRGRLNPNTGVRMYPNGDRVRPQLIAHNEGVYYGAIPQAPVTDLGQTGIVWSPAS